uniref:Uncharacterized protein n=1 Tax=viral metagenome TaxID=1070528 RepID=A0A6C0K9S8_9ZZZZ
MKWCLGLLFVISIAFLVLFRIQDNFGMSPGTMVQLQTSHVPTEEDLYYATYIYPRRVKKEIYNMTESDLH